MYVHVVKHGLNYMYNFRIPNVFTHITMISMMLKLHILRNIS